MNYKNFLFLSMLLLSGILVHSAEVSLEKASMVAGNFYYEKIIHLKGNVSIEEIKFDEIITHTSNGQNAYYVFKYSSTGFVIVAAEDVLEPIIGYSFDSEYVDKDQPDSYKYFMQSYKDAIDYIRNNNILQTPDIKKLWDYYSDYDPSSNVKSTGSKSVEPLLLCKWNQSFPYNVYCPVDPAGPGGHVYAGCVATAMAQVMYYWRHPVQGTGTHTYYYNPYGSLTANFGATTYQWEGMQNSIQHNNAGPIAELQYHCGVAVNMMYGPNGSGAYSTDVPPALVSYFGYSSDCYFAWKDNFSNQVWINKLKGNLDNSWPMYYSGYSSSGGHAFVCDGYQDDYFHFNFGWGGSSDGYYTLLTVNGFNNGQGAVFNIYPNSSYPNYCTGDKIITYKNGSFTDGSGPVENYENNAICSWLFSPQTGEDSISKITITFQAFETEANDFLTIFDGPTTQDIVLGTFSGNVLPPVINSTGNKVLVVFNTDGSGTARGWQAEFKATIPDFCKGLVELNDPSGSFSDGSFNFNYQNSSICLWKIDPPDAQSVTLSFTAFDTEANLDRVRIYDLVSQELLADYSGSFPATNLPAPVTSESGKMFVAFTTNSTVTATGWQANYSSVVTGIDPAAAIDEEFKVFPNPAKDKIRISSPNNNENEITIRLINLSGIELMNIYLTGEQLRNNFTMDVSGIKEGVYLLQFTGNTRTEIKRIVIQK